MQVAAALASVWRQWHNFGSQVNGGASSEGGGRQPLWLDF